MYPDHYLFMLLCIWGLSARSREITCRRRCIVLSAEWPSSCQARTALELQVFHVLTEVSANMGTLGALQQQLSFTYYRSTDVFLDTHEGALKYFCYRTQNTLSGWVGRNLLKGKLSQNIDKDCSYSDRGKNAASLFLSN